MSGFRGPLSNVSLWLALLLVTSILVVWPLVIMTMAAFKPATAFPFDPVPFVIDNIIAVFSSVRTAELLGTTLVYVSGSLAIGLPIAFALAWLVERTDLPGKRLIVFALTIALGLPAMLLSLGWSLWLSPRNGLANLVLRNLLGLDVSFGPLDGNTLEGMIFVTGLILCPGAFLMLSAVMRNMDSTLEEAAFMNGATPWTTIRRVTLPLLMPGLLAVAMFYAVVLIQFLDIPLALGLPGRTFVLSTVVFRLIRSEAEVPEYGLAATYAFIPLVLGFILMAFYLRASRHTERFRTISGRGFRPKIGKLGRWKYPAIAFVGGYLLLAIVAPLAILLWASLLPYYQPPSGEAFSLVSLDAYQVLLGRPEIWQAALNTIAVVVISATLGAVLSLLIVWSSVRQRIPGARLLEVISFVPLAIPGLVIALALLLAYAQTPIYGTIIIMIIAYITTSLPIGTRTLSGALIQIDRELEECASVHGAVPRKTLRRIVAPLMAPALKTVWVFFASHSVRDFTFPLMLGTSGNLLLAALVWSYWSIPDVTSAAALSIMVALALGVFSAVVVSFRKESTMG